MPMQAIYVYWQRSSFLAPEKKKLNLLAIKPKEGNSINQIAKTNYRQMMRRKKMERERERGHLPLFVPIERLAPEGLAPVTFRLLLRMQIKRARNTMAATDTDPRMIPTKAPTANPFSEWDVALPESCVCVPGPEWFRLLWDLPWGGEVYGGGGGAGPLSNEFPSYLFLF